MFKRLYCNNYRGLVNFEIELDELTLLLGRNGSGKTSVLDVMFALCRLLDGSAKVTDSSIFPERTLTRWQGRKEQTFELDVELDVELDGSVQCVPFTYRLEVEHEEGGRKARINREILAANGQPLFRSDRGTVQLYRDDHSDGPMFLADWSASALARVQPGPDNRMLTRFADFMGRVIVCSLSPASFATEAAEESERLGRDATNFAAWYRHVLQENPGQVAELTSELRKVIVGLDQLSLVKAGLDVRTLMVSFAEEGSKPYSLRLDEISDGQRALIALYALAKLTANQDCALFLDEPENCVALAEIQPWLMEIADSCGESLPQVVMCSHHPELIDYLGHENGILLSRGNGGVTRTSKLKDVSADGVLKLSELFARGWEQ